MRVKSLPPSARIVSGPAKCEYCDDWEVTVSLPVCSSKLASRAYEGLPELIEIDGDIYRKAGFRNIDCIAWYKRLRK